MKIKITNLNHLEASGLELLKGLNSLWITRFQVEQLASQYRIATGESAFKYPDYTVEVYSGLGDGWNLHRAPNGAGLLERVSHSEVQASGAKRSKEKEIADKASTLNTLTMDLLAKGIMPTTDPEWIKVHSEYTELCK